MMTAGPWTQPPWQAMPSMKFSGSIPLDIFSRAILHSSMPEQGRVLASALLPISLRAWPTAAATPPLAAKLRPKPLAWSRVASGILDTSISLAASME